MIFGMQPYFDPTRRNMKKNWGHLPPPPRKKNHLGSLFLVCNIILTQSEEDSKRQNRGLDGFRSLRPKKFSHQKNVQPKKISIQQNHQKSNFFSTTIFLPKFFSDQNFF